MICAARTRLLIHVNSHLHSIQRAPANRATGYASRRRIQDSIRILGRSGEIHRIARKTFAHRNGRFLTHTGAPAAECPKSHRLHAGLLIQIKRPAK
jgi:hypothetical protein